MTGSVSVCNLRTGTVGVKPAKGQSFDKFFHISYHMQNISYPTVDLFFFSASLHGNKRFGHLSAVILDCWYIFVDWTPFVVKRRICFILDSFGYLSTCGNIFAVQDSGNYGTIQSYQSRKESTLLISWTHNLEVQTETAFYFGHVFSHS